MEKNGPDLLVDIFRAYYDARRNKRNSKQQIAFEMDLEHNLVELYEQIRDRKYEPAPGVCFIVDRPVKRYSPRSSRTGLCIICCSTICRPCSRRA